MFPDKNVHLLYSPIQHLLCTLLTQINVLRLTQGRDIRWPFASKTNASRRVAVVACDNVTGVSEILEITLRSVKFINHSGTLFVSGGAQGKRTSERTI